LTASSEKNYGQQSIKIIAEIVVNMNILARKNISSKLKNLSFAIGYYSYTTRCTQAKRTTEQQKNGKGIREETLRTFYTFGFCQHRKYRP